MFSLIEQRFSTSVLSLLQARNQNYYYGLICSSKVNVYVQKQ